VTHIAIIVGEHSGDILGADLIQALRQHYPHATFSGIGGPRIKAQGFHALFDMEELAVMGIVEVLGRLRRLLQVRRELVTALLAAKPDVVIGIDAPDFNLRVEAALKHAGIKTVHYVSPSVWAWRPKRIFKIAAATDMVLSLLPFEKAFYDRFNVPCTFVGHTLADQIPLEVDKAAARVGLELDSQAPVLALMPGSRSNEIKGLAADFLHAAQQLQQQQPSLQIICNMVTAQKAQLFEQIWREVAPELTIRLYIGRSREVLTAADSVFIASGTATLEAMLCKTPMVVAYKMNWLTYQLVIRMVSVNYFSLPNLLADRPLVPELLQDAVTVPALVSAMQPLLQAEHRSLDAEFLRLHQQLRCDASAQAARAISELIDGN
jgi:lipid-A-disaccharide synthase